MRRLEGCNVALTDVALLGYPLSPPRHFWDMQDCFQAMLTRSAGYLVQASLAQQMEEVLHLDCE
jgi:hypothetical protein